nr:helix-turn-helix transcriptional regulator [uncultured Pseudodesulfovibrio sp.]
MDSSIHERLKEARGNLGRDEFAEILGVHKNTLGRYERGESESTSGLLALLCTQLGISSQWLLFGAGEMKHNPAGENEASSYVEVFLKLEMESN